MLDDNIDNDVQTYDDALNNNDIYITHERNTGICWHDIKLSKQAEDAIKYNKIFQIYGNCPILRKVLIERGWIEKKQNTQNDLHEVKRKDYKDKHEMLSAIEACHLSDLVKDAEPYFVYNANGSRTKKCTAYQQSPTVAYNVFKQKPAWSVEQELCAISRNNTWHYVEDVAEVNTPRSYLSYDQNEKAEFILNYKLTACVNVLKYVLTRFANYDTVFNVSGNVDLQMFYFAINQCKEFLFKKQHDDIDKSSISEITENEWNLFLENYYILIEDKGTFQLDSGNKPRIPLYLDLSKVLLQQIQYYWPEINCEGYRNIWIAKPVCPGPGPGTKINSRLNKICQSFKNSKYIVQKYLEEPLLIHRRQFSIRQYFLVTSTFPLEIWMHQGCYLKFSEVDFKRGSNEDSQDKILGFESFIEYLQTEYKESFWETDICPGMRKSIIGFMLNLQDSLLRSKKCYELFRCDFILDQEFQPWLIKVTSTPDLDSSTPKIAEIHSVLMSDLLKVVVDRVEDTETGKFMCVYRQTECVPYLRKSTSFVVRGSKLTIAYMRKPKFKDDFVELYQNPNVTSPDVKTLLRELKVKHQISNKFPLIPKLGQKRPHIFVTNVQKPLQKPSTVFSLKYIPTKQTLQRYKGSKAHANKNKRQHLKEDSRFSTDRYIRIDEMITYYPKNAAKVKSTKKPKDLKKKVIKSRTDSGQIFDQKPNKYMELPIKMQDLNTQRDICYPYSSNKTRKSCLIKRSETESAYISQPLLVKSAINDIEITSSSSQSWQTTSEQTVTSQKQKVDERKKAVNFSDARPFNEKQNTREANHYYSPQIQTGLSILNANYLYNKYEENGQEFNSCMQFTSSSSRQSSEAYLDVPSLPMASEIRGTNKTSQKHNDSETYQTSIPILNPSDINNKFDGRDIPHLSPHIQNPTTSINNGLRFRTALPIHNANYVSSNFKDPLKFSHYSYAQPPMVNNGPFQNQHETRQFLNYTPQSQEKTQAPNYVYVTSESRNIDPTSSFCSQTRKTLPILNASYLDNTRNYGIYYFEPQFYQTSAAASQTPSFINLVGVETNTSIPESKDNIPETRYSSTSSSVKSIDSQTISVSISEKSNQSDVL